MASFSNSVRGKLAVVCKPLTQQRSRMEKEPTYLQKSHPPASCLQFEYQKGRAFKAELICKSLAISSCETSKAILVSVFGIMIYTTCAFWLGQRIALKCVLIEHVLLLSLDWCGHSQNPQVSRAELSVFRRMYFKKKNTLWLWYTSFFFFLKSWCKEGHQFLRNYFFVEKGKKVLSVVIVKNKLFLYRWGLYILKEHSRKLII